MEINYTSPNWYSGKLYGKSSMSLYDKNGKEILHTGFRNINTLEELKKQVDSFHEFYTILLDMIENYKRKQP